MFVHFSLGAALGVDGFCDGAAHSEDGEDEEGSETDFSAERHGEFEDD